MSATRRDFLRYGRSLAARRAPSLRVPLLAETAAAAARPASRRTSGCASEPTDG